MQKGGEANENGESERGDRSEFEAKNHQNTDERRVRKAHRKCYAAAKDARKVRWTRPAHTQAHTQVLLHTHTRTQDTKHAGATAWFGGRSDG